jgi:hypothetical protein
LDPYWTDAGFLLALERFGYEVTDTQKAVIAFQRRFRPTSSMGSSTANAGRNCSHSCCHGLSKSWNIWIVSAVYDGDETSGTGMNHTGTIERAFQLARGLTTIDEIRNA